MALRIRPAVPGDLPQIYGVLGAAFDAPLKLFVDQTERDSTFRWRHARVAELDGRIVAHVRIFARAMLIRGVPVGAAGIGSVATLPAYEGSGYATALLHDALHEAHRRGAAIAYLFTGIPAYYERIGFRIVEQPGFNARAPEAAAIPLASDYTIRRTVDADTPALLRIYRAATAGATGAVLRTPRIWRDARAWLGEHPAGCLVAEHAGRPVAYIRSRRRADAYQVIEAECLPRHEPAIAALVRAVGREAARLALPIIALAPADGPLATVLRPLPSTRWSADVEQVPHPMMMRIVSLDSLLDALLPQLGDRARTHRGEPFSLSLSGPDGERATLAVGPANARRRARPGAFALDEPSTLAALLGQRCASKLVRPRPPRAVARRVNALLPERALRFWSSDRI